MNMWFIILDIAINIFSDLCVIIISYMVLTRFLPLNIKRRSDGRGLELYNMSGGTKIITGIITKYMDGSTSLEELKVLKEIHPFSKGIIFWEEFKNMTDACLMVGDPDKVLSMVTNCKKPIRWIRTVE